MCGTGLLPRRLVHPYLRGVGASRARATSSESHEGMLGGGPTHCSTSEPLSSTSLTVAMRGSLVR
jgi:hypothetical protein